MRISGSPPLRSSDASACSSAPSLRVSTSLPVTRSPHAAALTNSDGDTPTCARQSPRPILSRMSRSRVAASGMRKSASATHINATPSRLSSENSSISASTPPACERSARTASASFVACACVCARTSGAKRASAASARTVDASSARCAASMRSRSGASTPSPVSAPANPKSKAPGLEDCAQFRRHDNGNRDIGTRARRARPAAARCGWRPGLFSAAVAVTCASRRRRRCGGCRSRAPASPRAATARSGR